MATRRTSDAVYQRNREALRAMRLPCHLCGKPIDYDLPYRNALTGKPDPLAFSADHVDPVGVGGDNRGTLAAAHLGCNQRRGKRDLSATDIRKTSREW